MGPTFVAGTADSTDDNEHGTHVSGTVAAVNNSIGVLGVAPKAQVWGVKVLDYSGSGSWSNVASGIDWCAANGMKVVNMSLGGALDSAAVRTSCTNANAAGLLLVAAAGNEGGKKLSFPGGYISVFCVSAVDNKNALASFSSYGNQVDICAPGVNVLSTIPPDWYAYFNGTSMASPHVAGTAALVWGANPRFSRSDVRTRIQNKATNLGPAGWDNKFGYGLVNALKAVNP
jgi:subtilisin